ncbi:MAG: DUF5317 domain-containing protein [Sporichthyaceae bacterium]|nr:DUF5317 domain-containing protein [Sporichthyaceae bacterium]
MGLALYTVLLAGIAGHLNGGRIFRLGKLRLRRTGWLLAASGCQLAVALSMAFAVALDDPRVDYSALAIVAVAIGTALGYGLLAPFLTANLWLPGVALAALGVAANALVITVNGAMPVAIGAVRAVQAPVSDGALRAELDRPWPDDPRHAWAGPDTTLDWLGDVIPIPLPLRAEVVSVGDLLIAAGVGLFVHAGLRTGMGTGTGGRPNGPGPVQSTTYAARSTIPARESTTRGSYS